MHRRPLLEQSHQPHHPSPTMDCGPLLPKEMLLHRSRRRMKKQTPPRVL